MLFENNNVLHQLRCGGVLEAVRISCAGFPTKTPYPDFVDHFWNLVPELLSNEHLDDMALSKAVLKKANLQGYQCGLNKVACYAQDAWHCMQFQSISLLKSVVWLRLFQGFSGILLTQL